MFPRIYQRYDGYWMLVRADGDEIAYATEQEALMVSQPTAAEEWATGAKSLLRKIEDVLTESARLSMLYADNDLLDAIIATADGETVTGMLMSKQRALCVGMLFNDFQTFLAEPLVIGDTTMVATRRRVIVSRD